MDKMAANPKISIHFDLLTPIEKIRSDILSLSIKHLNKRLFRASVQNMLIQKTQNAIYSSLIRQPEYIEMVNPQGRLRAELGVVDSSQAINRLVQTWIESVELTTETLTHQGDKKISGGMQITAIQADFEDVIRQNWASYVTEKGVEIPWLEWLLLNGVEILITTHFPIRHPKFAKYSRTNTNTIMVKTKGRGWGVPARYAGTLRNNYCTRAIEEALPTIIESFEDVLINAL